jgi:hypothetical protein
MTLEDSIKDLIKDVISTFDGNSHPEVLVHLQEFITLFNTLAESQLKVRVYLSHLLEKLHPDDTQDKFIYQVKVERCSGVGFHSKETALLNCHLLRNKYAVCVIPSGGSSSRWCYSKEELFENLVQLLRADESVWKMQAVREGF